jgi:hypothetical protein
MCAVSLAFFMLCPVEITWYDPALGGINCNEDCTTIGSSTPLLDEHYGTVLACPIEFYGATFHIRGSKGGLADGEWTCLDGGSAMVVYDGVLRIDLLSRRPVWRETLTAIVDMRR